MAQKKYYWLKLREDFFENEEIKMLESMDNGKDYVIFLLKLQLRSINSEGHLYFKNLMPYNEKMLATITNTNIDIVRSAMKVFSEIGLVTIFDDGTIFMEQVQELIGKEGESAKRVREYRERQKMLKEPLHCNGAVTKSNTDIDIDIDIDKDKECDDFFEEIWKLYPRKLGKSKVKATQKKALCKVGREKLEMCIERFIRHMKRENRPEDKMPYGSTFFNGGYADYLDENYQETETKREGGGMEVM